MIGNVNFNFCSSEVERKMEVEKIFASVDEDYNNGKIKEEELLTTQAQRLKQAGFFTEAASAYRYEIKLRKYHHQSTADLPDPDKLEALAETMRNAGLSTESINQQLKQEE